MNLKFIRVNKESNKGLHVIMFFEGITKGIDANMGPFEVLRLLGASDVFCYFKNNELMKILQKEDETQKIHVFELLEKQKRFKIGY